MNGRNKGWSWRICSYSWELSPDGRYIAGIAKGGRGYEISLISLSDKQAKVVETIPFLPNSMNISSLCWSDNSRYLSYGFADKGGRKIGVYDTASGMGKHAQIPSGELGLEALLQVKLSDDGLQAVIVKERQPAACAAQTSGGRPQPHAGFPVSRQAFGGI